jgi:hypothetical protein
MTIIITLSFAGADTGPFDLYSNVDGFVTPFETGVSKADLLSGYQTSLAPDGTITVRLLDLGALCTPNTTDIYSCATPNCDFSGSIICDVTTTTTTSSSTSTTTSTDYPGVSPCTWSTYGGNSGEIAVYDFNTNSSTPVLVPNDFTTTVGINRPICSTGDKLWLASVTNSEGTVAYIREWNIITSSSIPTLSYVREITININSLSYKNIWGTKIAAITTTSDNNTLLVGFGDRNSGSTTMGVYEWDISTSGDILLNENNKIDREYVNFGNTYGITTELTGMFITNDGNVIISTRYYEDQSSSNASNRIKQYPGLVSSGNWSPNPSTPIINLQNSGVPEFTSTWTGSTKAMPVWGVNGLIQVIQPETLEVYNISQTAPYNATLETTVADDSVWIHTSTGCANVGIKLTDPDCEATWIPALTERDAQNNIFYIGPVTFTYQGIQVTASADDNFLALIPGNPSGGIPDSGCSGLSNPAATNKLATVQGNDFSITLTFESPINNLPIRAAVLNTSPDFSNGDVYEITTNTGTPSISISNGCNVQVQGNRIGGGVPDYNTEGDGEFIVTTPTNFTIITISGNAPTGGPILLGCVTPPLSCSRIFTLSVTESCTDGICAPDNLRGSYNRVYSQNTVTNTIEQVVLPGGSYFQTSNSDITNNYFIGQVNNNDAQGDSIVQFTRWSYDTTLPSGTPSNFTWEGILYSVNENDLPNAFPPRPMGVSTVNDNLIVLSYNISSSAGGGQQVFEAEFVDGSTTLAVALKFFIPAPFNGSGEHVVTLKEDGTPNKFIALRSDYGTQPYVISQFDYDTGNFEVDILGPPGNWNPGGDMAVVDDYLYVTLVSTISGVGKRLWRVNLQTHAWEEVSNEDAYMGGSSGSLPLCRTNDGFAIIGTTTTTTTDPDISTTTTTTTPIPGVRTIFTKFSAGSEPA